MHTLFTSTFHLLKTVSATMLAAVVLLAGCAAEPTRGTGHQGPTCGAGAVLYCELSPPDGRCQCADQRDIRDMMRAFSGR